MSRVIINDAKCLGGSMENGFFWFNVILLIFNTIALVISLKSWDKANKQVKRYYGNYQTRKTISHITK